MAGLLRGRRLLVTGASAGIGAAVARAAVAAGARVALLARNKDRLADLATELGPDAIPVTCDITDDVAIPRAVDDAVARLGGGLDGLVNAAGVFTAGPLSDTDPAAWRAMFEVNVLGLLAVTKAAVPHLRAGNAPSVVNVSSMSGRRVARFESGVYAATKFAVHALGESLRGELAPRGIRVSTVAPGLVDTGIADGWPAGEFADAFRERLHGDGLPAAAVADAVVHVLSTPAEVNVVEYAVLSVRQ
ncbi:MAG TPA: SDR family NAD(P)-dependent oxidoreductase [Pseudonocardia sp.]|jgi:NADP-dependent 3-hydroxy acid dehydrogenase YdfG|nr:SDR family NAD(P)-dependent oxidoreductase [Pseudonocardia sp.]